MTSHFCNFAVILLFVLLLVVTMKFSFFVRRSNNSHVNTRFEKHSAGGYREIEMRTLLRDACFAVKRLLSLIFVVTILRLRH